MTDNATPAEVEGVLVAACVEVYLVDELGRRSAMSLGIYQGPWRGREYIEGDLLLLGDEDDDDPYLNQEVDIIQRFLGLINFKLI